MAGSSVVVIIASLYFAGPSMVPICNRFHSLRYITHTVVSLLKQYASMLKNSDLCITALLRP